MPELKFSVVVPCYNEENAILDTIKNIAVVLGVTGEYELIIVDDGSTDSSPQILQAANQEFSMLRLLRHPVNRGYGASLKTGIRRAMSDVVIITDADGTYPIERIPEMIEMSADADMVVGTRTAVGEVTYSFIRKIPKLFLKWYASWIAGQNIPDFNSGFRMLRKNIVEKFFNILPNGFSFTTTITLAMLTNYYDVKYLPIGYSQRIGKSKIKPVKDTLNFVQLIVRTGMYFAPLRVFSPIILLLSFGFLASVSYDIFYLKNLTDKTLILLLFDLNTVSFALLADMIDKRSSR